MQHLVQNAFTAYQLYFEVKVNVDVENCGSRLMH